MKARSHTTGQGWGSPQSGMTLIELMIVVAVIAILAAIAYPSYTEQVAKGRRAEGRAALLIAGQRLERYYTQFNTYETDLGKLGIASTSGDDPSNAAYDITVEAGGGGIGSSYVIVARPRFSDTRCGTLRLNSLGVKEADGTLGSERCWR